MYSRPQKYVMLVEAITNVKIDQSRKNKMAKEFKEKGLDGNGTFMSVGKGLNAVSEVLSNNGIEFDETLNADLFMADKGNRLLHLAYSNPQDATSPTEITKNALSFSWYKRNTDNYEIAVYIS